MSENPHAASITEASVYLRALAEHYTQVYQALPDCRAILLTGSPSEGVSDNYSDLDIIRYYDALPPEAALYAVLESAGAIRHVKRNLSFSELGKVTFPSDLRSQPRCRASRAG